MSDISFLNQFPVEKLSLSLSIHTIPLSFLILGLVEYFFFSQIINFNWVRKICKYFSRSKPSTQYQVGKRKQEAIELSERKPRLSEKNMDGGSIYLQREEVEMVMGKIGFFCQPEGVKLHERFGSEDFSHLFEEKEPSFDEVKGAFDVFDENRDGFIDAGELQRVVGALGLEERAEMGNCKRMISVFDENGDGRIDFNEFVKLMENSFC